MVLAIKSKQCVCDPSKRRFSWDFITIIIIINCIAVVPLNFNDPHTRLSLDCDGFFLFFPANTRRAMARDAGATRQRKGAKSSVCSVMWSHGYVTYEMIMDI